VKYQINYNDQPLFKAEITDREKADQLIKIHMAHHGIETDDPQNEFFNLVSKYIVGGTDYEFPDFEKDGVVIWDIEQNEFDKEKVFITDCGPVEWNLIHRGDCLGSVFYEESPEVSKAIARVNWNLRKWSHARAAWAFRENLVDFIVKNGRAPDFEKDEAWKPLVGLGIKITTDPQPDVLQSIKVNS